MAVFRGEVASRVGWPTGAGLAVAMVGVTVSAARDLSAVGVDGLSDGAGLAGAGDDEQATAATSPSPHNRIPSDLVLCFMVSPPVKDTIAATSSHRRSKWFP